MVLHGWKEIAHYLGCGIRTAQRWEAQCAMPVNRPRRHLRSPVLAQSEALDEWAGGGARPALPDDWEARWKNLAGQVAELRRQVDLLAGNGAGDLASQPHDAERRNPVVADRRQAAAAAFDA